MELTSAEGVDCVDAAGFAAMTKEDKRLKALGTALRAKLKATDEMPAEVQSLLLRLLLRDAEKLPIPHRISA